MSLSRPAFFLFVVSLWVGTHQGIAQRVLYTDPGVPVERRVDDLVSRMTLEEKVSQMMNSAAAIPRLGIPEYNWWNEALHGVARAGIATVFPQAIGMAATFDEKLVYRMADVVSTEARAKHHEAARRGDRGIYKGLTFWSPNINIFRDPRWGRGQETWGEDPFLTGRLGSAFVRGMQGNDPKYLKTVSTVKHFAVHSGPEPDRHTFDAVVSERDLRETYLPAFRETIVKGGALGVMCAYNRVDGLPACGSDKLLVDILRGEWRFSGHVVSDCGAIDDIYIRHKFLPTEAEASALGVKKGTDLTCGREYRSLVQAVKNGLISEAEIDTAVKHLMTIRFRLGMFDPPEMVKYAQIPYSENDTPAHRSLALEAARESIVLLKNQSRTLPLRRDLKTIAVIGPNADAPDVLLGNYNGTPSRSVTPLQGIRSKLPNARVLYSAGMYSPGIVFEPVAPEFLSAGGIRGLKGEYFNNRELKGEPDLVRIDDRINFTWAGDSPDRAIKVDGFSARWTGGLTAPDTGKYTFGFRGNGGVRIFLDEKLVAEELKNTRTRNVLQEIDLEAGRTYQIRIEYFENNNQFASARLVWRPPLAETRMRDEALQIARSADAVVMVMGITPSVEGEEMDVKLDGFRGGDRTDIELPKPQTALIKAVQATGKLVVLVLMGGSALAVNWENENVPAILDAWYPGEEGGTAIADVLFGDYNPAGRLPVTFYRSVGDLPPFDDYRMEGRTYRYFRGQPIYPFGYGLSYTSFRYSDLKFPKKVQAGGDLAVSASVQNTGSIAGDEVVQLYVTNVAASVPVPIRSLAGVERMHLKPGEKRLVSFTLTPRQMSVILDNGKRVVEPGKFQISVGGGQPATAPNGQNVTGSFLVSGPGFNVPER